MDSHLEQEVELVGADDLDHLYNSTSAIAQIGEKLAELCTEQTGDGSDFAKALVAADNIDVTGTPYEGKEPGDVVESVLSEINKPVPLGPHIKDLGLG